MSKSGSLRPASRSELKSRQGGKPDSAGSNHITLLGGTDVSAPEGGAATLEHSGNSNSQVDAKELWKKAHRVLTVMSAFNNMLLDQKEIERRRKSLRVCKPITIAKKIEQICQRPRLERSDEDVMDLCALSGFLCSFIRDQPAATQQRIARVAEFMSVEKNSYVIRQGTKGDKFFIVVNGKIEVQVRQKGSDKPDTVGLIKAGMTFGDLALFNAEPRAASCVARSHSDFLVVSREDFLSIFERQQAMLSMEACSFLRQKTRWFGGTEYSELEKFAHHLSMVRVPPGHIFKPDTDNKVFFIKDGECVLYMPAHREKKEKGVESGLDALQQLQSAHLSQYNDDDEEVAEEKLSDDKESDTESRDLVLSRLEVGSMFGETCVFHDLRRGWLVKSTTPCELYVTAKDLFVEHADSAVTQRVHDEAAFKISYLMGRHGFFDKPGGGGHGGHGGRGA